MVLADSSRVPRVPEYSGVLTMLEGVAYTRLLRSMVQLSRRFYFLLRDIWEVCRLPRNNPQPHTDNDCNLTSVWFGLSPFRSPLLRASRFLSLPSGTEMFQFPEFAPHGLCIQPRVIRFFLIGFPHSEIYGSTLV